MMITQDEEATQSSIIPTETTADEAASWVWFGGLQHNRLVDSSPTMFVSHLLRPLIQGQEGTPEWSSGLGWDLSPKVHVQEAWCHVTMWRWQKLS